MLQHAREHNHHFRKEDVTILASEHDWVKRGIKEAIYIQTLNPSINIDPGRHKLSSHFDSILNNAITTPPMPVPHDADKETLINTVPRRQGRPRKEQPTTNSATLHSPQHQQQQQPSQPTNEQMSIHIALSQSTTPKTVTTTNLGQRRSERLLSLQETRQQRQ